MLHTTAKALLGQLSDVISACDEEDYSRPLSELSHSTVGQHVRHTLEFFICLFRAEEFSVVNYDARAHDSLIEANPRLALQTIDDIEQFLSNHTADFAVAFQANYSLSPGEDSIHLNSSFYRELAYNIEHAIHHMALLKVAVIHSLTYIHLPPDFGVASSTIRYEADRKKKAKV